MRASIVNKRKSSNGAYLVCASSQTSPHPLSLHIITDADLEKIGLLTPRSATPVPFCRLTFMFDPNGVTRVLTSVTAGMAVDCNTQQSRNWYEYQITVTQVLVTTSGEGCYIYQQCCIIERHVPGSQPCFFCLHPPPSSK